jgi:rRNA maturation endonuclease Nob1
MKIIADSSAFINGYESCFQFEEIYVVPEVFHEVKSKDLTPFNIKVVEPKKETIEFIKKTIKKKSAIFLKKLSETDIKILALAYELKLPVATDDYRIQNALKYLGLKFFPVLFRGIRDVRF